MEVTEVRHRDQALCVCIAVVADAVNGEVSDQMNWSALSNSFLKGDHTAIRVVLPYIVWLCSVFCGKAYQFFKLLQLRVLRCIWCC